jgi:hypothetical protein
MTRFVSRALATLQHVTNKTIIQLHGRSEFLSTIPNIDVDFQQGIMSICCQGIGKSFKLVSVSRGADHRQSYCRLLEEMSHEHVGLA